MKKRIKIVFIHNKLVCGGAEKALLDLISLMDKTIFDISVLVQYEGGEWTDRFLKENIHLVYYNDFYLKSKGLGRIVKKLILWACLRYEGKFVIDLLFPKGVDIVVNFSSWEKDLLPFSKRAKSVMYIHGDAANNDNIRKYLEYIQFALPNYHRFICVSEMACRSFVKMTGIEDRVKTYYNPLNSDFIHEKKQDLVDLDSNVPVICAVGRLSQEKGFCRLIRIHRSILDCGVRHKLIIVGGGPEREQLEKIIEQTGTENSVYLTGYQNNPYPYMKQCRFMVCSSFTEGLPVIAMEALSLGVPMVSALPVIAEVFGKEPCGLITENDDESLKDGIYKMLTDEQLYNQTKQAAERRSMFFDGRTMVREIEKEFMELAGT